MATNHDEAMAEGIATALLTLKEAIKALLLSDRVVYRWNLVGMTGFEPATP
jgi:hypothetical protein